VFHVAARDTPHGKKAAWYIVRLLDHNDRTLFLTFVPALKMAPRAPFGPSEVLKAGILFDGIAVDLQWSAARRRETCAY